MNTALTSICHWVSPNLILGVNKPLNSKLTALISPQTQSTLMNFNYTLIFNTMVIMT